jgi:Family of unknown function (DUF5681)
MSEKSNATQPLESQANGSQSTPAEGHNVGPGSPPLDKRWRKGGPSPNPRGRPRKEQSLLPDVRKAFERAINKKVAVPRGDKTVLMTRVEIGLEQLLNQFAKGERQARRDLIEYADKLGIDFLANHQQTLEQALKPNYQTILDSYVARRSGNVTPAPHTLAPPELLDDDAAVPEPTKPDLNKPVSRMTSAEKWALYQRLLAEDAETATAKANKP